MNVDDLKLRVNHAKEKVESLKRTIKDYEIQLEKANDELRKCQLVLKNCI